MGLNELADRLANSVVAALKQNVDPSKANELSNKVRYNRFLFGELTEPAKKKVVQKIIPANTSDMTIEHIKRLVKIDANLPESVLTDEIRSILSAMLTAC